MRGAWHGHDAGQAGSDQQQRGLNASRRSCNFILWAGEPLRVFSRRGAEASQDSTKETNWGVKGGLGESRPG